MLPPAIGEVESPEAALVRLSRLDEKITCEEERVREREMQLKRQQEQKKAEQACKEIVSLMRIGEDDASVEALRQALFPEDDDRILDEYFFQMWRSLIQTHICSGILQLTRPVRLNVSSLTFINDERYCSIFEVLIPHLSEASLRQALEFAAKRSGIQHSQYESYYPLLKPLLKGLPGVKFSQLAFNGHGTEDTGVLATIKHGGESLLACLLL